MVGETNEQESINFLGIYLDKHLTFKQHINFLCSSISRCIFAINRVKHILPLNLFPLIPACTARPGLPLSPPETAFLESPYYRPQTASIGDRHHPTNFHSVTYTQTDDAAFEAGSDNDHKSFLRMRVIFKVEYPAALFRFRRVLDDILSSFDVF